MSMTGANAARAVLTHFGDPAGVPNGSFVTHLLAAFGSADPSNFRTLADAFPDLGKAMHLAANVHGGMEALREMSRSNSDDFAAMFELT